MRIKQLPPAIANQIAAGEVIERPASVVKELLENALDAQANHIIIDIGYGGLNQIKISDNGQGIFAEDLPLAIAANATSKISQLDDLYAIASMGFRGEALASIASVSRLTISSKPVEQEHAMKLECSAGESVRIKPCARAQGTTIDVCDIFFNAPVRKKFLKSAELEFQAIELIIKRFALSSSHIAIQLTHNGKQRLNVPAAHCKQSRLARVSKIMGKNFTDNALSFEIAHAGLSLSGLISTANYQRSQNDRLWFYLNQRMIKDKLIYHAIKKAYEPILYPGRYPSCLLYLTINPREVDVNVHPTKHEVRFQQPRLVHDFICSQLQRALQLSLPYKSNPDTEVSKESKELKLCEPYLPPPLSLSIAKSKEPKNWIHLNRAFAILTFNDQPYLVDVINLQRTWLLARLSMQKQPFESRPLLVPVNFSVKERGTELIKSYKPILSQLGIEFDWMQGQTLRIRTLPCSVPHLALNEFLMKVFVSPLLSIKELLALLTSCQNFNINYLQENEKELLIDYLLGLTSDKLEKIAKHLSFETCRGLLNA